MYWDYRRNMGFILSAYFLTVALGGYINEKLLKRMSHKLIAVISAGLLSLFVTLLSFGKLMLVLVFLLAVVSSFGVWRFI
ncbi:hypothetical protein B9Q01_04825 [Candidatus Marsarchaeota G1 archaeon OSP_D]|uniref:Uncharacterized protein n=2 Tax=Candidatus Marsarchaeota group 1 TaxID=2203770 RepID=A0A2R6AAL7_9ARCH|nr:MAG: hypothetical protein B9Q01_04825 [Candidatus Marsarchaeota G1 archaeon OSP_D]PSN88195.1 MAG: hypothetical protein B9Q00_06365 [Candidatus Marsarchaeota G1 archaeon OSP_C]